MKISRTILAFVLALTVVIAPTACSKNGGGDNNTSSSVSSVESGSTFMPEQSSSVSSTTTTPESSFSSTQSSITQTQSSSSSQLACEHSFEQTSTVEPTLTENGYREFKCSLCKDIFKSPIPKLSSENYTVTEVEATCQRAGVVTYTSNIYGTFSVAGDGKLQHSAYNGSCIRCGTTLYDNFKFDQNNMSDVSNVGAGPRVIELQNGDFLLAFDDGKNNVMVVRSSDKGKTWSDQTWTVASAQENCLAANTSLYQFDNGDILCAYRLHGDTGLTGSSQQKYIRKIVCSISKDNGYTWEFHSTIVNVYELGHSNSTVNSTIESLSSKWVGVYEPCFGEIDGKLTAMYADDFSSTLVATHSSQYIMSVTWDPSQNAWVDRNICLDGTKKKTVAGYNMVSRDGMPVFDELSDGTVVLVTEGTYMREAGHPFIICLSYSKDKGKTFSTPVAVFIPRKDAAKGAAPFVCVTDDDRLVISYQTDEDTDSPGYDDPSTPNLNEADAYSVMKIIISDGTPIEQITGPENFLDSINIFGTPRNYGSSWNGMMLVDDTIYCVTGTDWNMNGGYGIKMQSSKIPEMPEWLHYESCASQLTVRNGSMTVNGNWITTTSANTLVTHKTEIYNGTVSVDVVPGTAQDVALIFRANSPSATGKYWESGISYYLFMLNKNGEVFIATINNGWKEIITSQRIRNTYNPTQGYSLKVELNDDVMTCYLDDEMILSLRDENFLTGTNVGIRAAESGAKFCNLWVTPSDN